MYQAIYRKYRPKTFDEVVGQDEITKVLKNQVDSRRLGHAYIFSGTRGTGKTSCAKIMARAVNCLRPQDGNPCNDCENCLAISKSRTMDVVEMDAASNRRIDDIRDLRDKVIYPPAQLKYKVYIIDEVHMLTTEGFNALLKIMEEPPSHLIFILATTELHKIPDTIQSRCQRFEFSRLTNSQIQGSIEAIAKDLGYRISQGASAMIADVADGAMRDAQSTLDQVIAGVDGEEISEENVQFTIGMAQFSDLSSLVGACLEWDLQGALAIFDEMVQEGVDPGETLKGLLDYYRNILLVKSGVEGSDLSEEEVKSLRVQAEKASAEDLSASMKTIIDNQAKLAFTDQADVLVQITLVDLTKKRDARDLESRIRSLENQLGLLEEKLSQGSFEFSMPASKKSNAESGSFQGDYIHMDYEPEYVPEESLGFGPEEVFATEEDQEVRLPSAKDDPGKVEGKEEKKESHSRNLPDWLISDWAGLVRETIEEKPMWIMWLDGAEPYSLEDSFLTVLLRDCGETARHKANDDKEDFEKLASSYYKKDLKLNFIFSLEEVEGKKEKSLEDKLREMFGENLEIID